MGEEDVQARLVDGVPQLRYELSAAPGHIGLRSVYGGLVLQENAPKADEPWRIADVYYAVMIVNVLIIGLCHLWVVLKGEK